MYSNLNIVEEYELPIYQFNEEFIEGKMVGLEDLV
jgi:hypothetical protein